MGPPQMAQYAVYSSKIAIAIITWDFPVRALRLEARLEQDPSKVCQSATPRTRPPQEP